MVKGISAVNRTVRKFVFGAAIAGTAMLLGASSPIKNTRAEKEPQRTELMLKESAEALKLNSLQQTQPTVPTVHNKKLDDMFLLFAENDEEHKMVNDFINEVYAMYGTYLASALIQTQIDYNMFIAFLDGNAEILKRFPYGENRYEDATNGNLETAKKVKKTIMEWLEPNYSKVFVPVFESFDHKPTAEEFITTLDNSVKKNEYKLFLGTYFNEYGNPSKSFKDKQVNNNLSSIQNNSDLIAYKVHCADVMLFSNLLHNFGLINNRENLSVYGTYLSGFMEAASP